MRTPYRLGLAGLAALSLLAAGCGAKSSPSSGGFDWSTATTASAGGGMSALVAAAKQEGTLNVIALPADWANYGNIIKDFTAKYGIKVNFHRADRQQRAGSDPDPAEEGHVAGG